jgi:hypothetical protein
MHAVAAYVFCVCTALVVVFQMALALGAPWGEMAMGGRFPGRLPPQMRVAAVVQAALLVCIALVVLARAGLAFDAHREASRTAIWFVVAFCTLSAILNGITPSRKERLLWGPVTALLFVCGLIVARS